MPRLGCGIATRTEKQFHHLPADGFFVVPL